MPWRQLAAIFCNRLFPAIYGNALISLIPIYTSENLEASESALGVFLSIGFAALTAGTIAGGWLSDTFGHRKRFLWLVAINIPMFWLMGRAQNITQLALLFSVMWFFNGTSSALTTILTGISSQAETRGMSFGIVWLPLALGALLGGLVSGPIVDWGGFEALFIGCAIFQLGQLLAVFFVEDEFVAQAEQTMTISLVDLRAWTGLGGAFIALFLASNLTYITPYVGFLGRPLVMDDLGFDSTAISSTVAFSGAFSLPLMLVVGWLSDRIGRVPLIVGCYALNVAGMLLLSTATDLWQFQLSTGMLLGVNASLVAGSAYVTDIMPPEQLGRALALFSATAWIGGVVGFVLTGYIVEIIGTQASFLMAATLPIVRYRGAAGVWTTDFKVTSQGN